MAGKFKLTITLGDDAMQEPAHVAEALRELSKKLDDLAPRETEARGGVIDDNGNRCGEWIYENEPEDEDDN